MDQAIGQVLSLAVGVALSPIPIIGVVLMLATPRARSNGVAFLLGWIVGLTAVGTVVLLVSSGADASESGNPAAWVNALKIGLGVLLLGLALWQWRARPRAGAPVGVPKWMRTIDQFEAPKAAGLGLVLSAVNLKNLPLIVSAAAAIADAQVSAGQEALALAVFVAIGTLGVGAPVAIYLAMGQRSRTVLDGLHRWMAQHNAAIIVVICLLIGTKLIGDGLSGF